jgi:hypothetical protein
MVTIGECLTCGEERCTSAHDCPNCFGEAEGRVCDRGHAVCSDCSWYVGDGPDARKRCLECDAEDERRHADEEWAAEQRGDEMREERRG